MLFGTKTFKVLAVSLLSAGGLMLFNSCSTSKEFFNKYQVRENATKLRVGMTKTEVIGIMGPPIDEKFGQKDVLFYYVRTEWQDFQTTIDETLPVVFKDGKVIGFGTEYYQNHIMFRPKYRLRNKPKK